MADLAITPLDLAWEAINALGGAASNDEDRIINETIGRAIAEIEKLGGSDPVHRRWLAENSRRGLAGAA